MNDKINSKTPKEIKKGCIASQGMNTSAKVERIPVAKKSVRGWLQLMPAYIRHLERMQRSAC